MIADSSSTGRLPRPDRRRHVGRGRQLGRRRAGGPDGAEVIGITLQLYDHGEASALRPARRPRHLRRPNRRRAAGSPITSSTTDPLRDSVTSASPTNMPGSDSDPCVSCNQSSSSPTCSLWPGTSARLPRHRHCVQRVVGPEGPELHRAADPRATRAISCSRPLASADICASRSAPAQAGGSRIARDLGLIVADKPTARTSASSERRLCLGGEEGSARGGPAGRGRRFGGRRLGEHRGLIHFTVGQRRGSRSAARRAALRRPPGAGGAAGRGRAEGGAGGRAAGCGPQLAGRGTARGIGRQGRSMARPGRRRSTANPSISKSPNSESPRARRRSSTTDRECSRRLDRGDGRFRAESLAARRGSFRRDEDEKIASSARRSGRRPDADGDSGRIMTNRRPR